MASVNRVTLLGNLGQDPEVRKTTNGTSVVNVNLATSRRWKDEKGKTQERTDWHGGPPFQKGADPFRESRRPADGTPRGGLRRAFSRFPTLRLGAKAPPWIGGFGFNSRPW